MNYSALSKNAKIHFSDKYLPDRLPLATKTLLFIRDFGFILTIPLVSSLFMAVRLDGTEQNLFISASLLLTFTVITLLATKHQLVLDTLNTQAYLELRTFGIKLKQWKSKSLAKTVITLSPSVHKESSYQLIIEGQHFVIGDLTETEQALRFISSHFQLPAFEQVSQYPEIVPLGELKISSDAQAPSRPIESLWNSTAWLKLLLPLPVFITLGFVLKLFGS
ncbi:hypothetical protein [Shewanella woodyi]|uniref:hypothetical protein n=1 Tax=Shewanella woodyi TaxID=60961 RepID=UPI0007F8F360|nr:hypothetical protein [Shewanella woodyi]